MSQNNGGLNWDQIQLPNFSGSSSTLEAAARLLDGALANTVQLNKGVMDDIRGAKEADAEKALLQNIYKHRTGRSAQDALASGSLYDGIDLNNLTPAALRELQKDIKGIYGLEKADIDNTQGYLNHDLTKANTSNVYDQISNRRQKLAMEMQTSASKRATEEANNNFLRDANNYLSSLSTEERNSPEALRQIQGLMNKHGVQDWDGYSKQVSGMSNITKNTYDMLTTSDKAQDHVDSKIVNNIIDKATSNAGTTTEWEMLVASEWDNLTPKQRNMLLTKHGDKLPSLQQIDDSNLIDFGSEDLESSSNNLVGQDPNRSILFSDNEPVSETVKETPTGIAKQIMPSKDYVKESQKYNIQINPDANNILDPYFGDNLDASIEDYLGTEHWLDEYKIPDETQMKIANVASTYEGQSFGNVFMENSPFSGVSRPKTDAENKLPFTGSEIQELYRATKGGILNEPVTQENLNKWATLLHRRNTASGTKEGNAREFRNKQKLDAFNIQLEEVKKVHENKYRQEGMRQGLTGNTLERYIDNASRAAAYNDIRSKEEYQNLLKTRPENEVINERASRNLESIRQSPDRAVSNIVGESKEMARLASEAALGAGYVDPSTFQDVPNNAMSIGKEISKLNSDISENDATDAVLRTMNRFKISAKEAGRLVAAVGGKFDEKLMSTIKTNNQKLEREYKVNEINGLANSISKIEEELIKLGRQRSQILNKRTALVDNKTKENLVTAADVKLHKKLVELEKEKSKLRKIYEGLAIQE